MVRRRLPTPVDMPQVLSAPAVVGRLRALVCAPEGVGDDGVDENDRAYAAGQLARLAAAGVPGADPADWHGMTTVSTVEPLWSGDGHTVTMSPSTLQTLQDCPLRWLLERHGGRNARRTALHGRFVDPRTDRAAGQVAGADWKPSWRGSGRSCRSSRSGSPATNSSGTAPCSRRS